MKFNFSAKQDLLEYISNIEDRLIESTTPEDAERIYQEAKGALELYYRLYGNRHRGLWGKLISVDENLSYFLEHIDNNLRKIKIIQIAQIKNKILKMVKIYDK